MDQLLISSFVEEYSSIQRCLKQRNVQKARDGYIRLLEIYKAINSSQLEAVHKEIAYDQISKLHGELSEYSFASPLAGSLKAKDFLVVSFFALIIGFVFFFKPEYVGLATADIANHAPVWIGATEFRVNAGSYLTINLREHFTDSDFDELVFLSTEADGVNVAVSGSEVTIMPADRATGMRELTFIASDTKAVTRVPVVLIIG